MKKRKEFLDQVRSLGRDELIEKANGLAEELMRLRFKKASRQLDQSHQLREVRRNLARVQTILQTKTTAS